MEEKSYTSTHPLGHTGLVKGSLYLYVFIMLTTVSSIEKNVSHFRKKSWNNSICMFRQPTASFFIWGN